MATYKGRNLPLNDWEGDDNIPGSGGSYVTCMDTATGRMLAYATNGRITRDGKVIRSYVKPADPNGINFDQAAQAVKSMCGRDLVHYSGWLHPSAWIRQASGLIMIGVYNTIPRNYRWQASADFNHAMFVAYSDGVNALLYDPLDPQTHNYGRMVPVSILWPFMESLGWTGGYIPLEHL